MLLLLQFLDDPFHSGVGGLRAGGDGADRVIINEALDAVGQDLTPALRRVGRRASREPTRRSTSRRSRPWVEIVATVLLALAAVATAWSSYQANRWNGEQAKAFSRGNALRIEAHRAAGLAESQTEVDVATFIQWVDATATDDAELAEFYLDRFRDEFRPAFDAWMATDPFTDPDAPPTPFAMDEYRLAADRRSRATWTPRPRKARRHRPAQRAAVDQLRAGRRRCSPSALFFAGMSTKVPSPGCAVGDGDHGLHRLPGRGRVDRLVPHQLRGLAGDAAGPPAGRAPMASTCQRNESGTRTWQLDPAQPVTAARSPSSAARCSRKSSSACRLSSSCGSSRRSYSSTSPVSGYVSA